MRCCERRTDYSQLSRALRTEHGATDGFWQACPRFRPLGIPVGIALQDGLDRKCRADHGESRPTELRARLPLFVAGGGCVLDCGAHRAVRAC